MLSLHYQRGESESALIVELNWMEPWFALMAAWLEKKVMRGTSVPFDDRIGIAQVVRAESPAGIPKSRGYRWASPSCSNSVPGTEVPASKGLKCHLIACGHSASFNAALRIQIFPPSSSGLCEGKCMRLLGATVV